MSEQRLSKLQKWILEFLYNQQYYVGRLTMLKYYARQNEGLFNPETKRNAIDVSFSRSLRSLNFKGLIEANTANPAREPSGRCFGRKKNFADEGSIKWLFLTDKGEVKVKKLLNVKK